MVFEGYNTNTRFFGPPATQIGRDQDQIENWETANSCGVCKISIQIANLDVDRAPDITITITMIPIQDKMIITFTSIISHFLESQDLIQMKSIGLGQQHTNRCTYLK